MPTQVTRYGDVHVLTVEEELAGEAVAQFNQRANAALKDDARKIVVDCSQLEGIDSGGLEALVELQGQCEIESGAMKLCCLSPTCEKILEVTRLRRRFECLDDLDSAVRSLA